MPLHDSLGASQFARLPKMTSIPSTDDLRYLISEAKKRIGKPVELPFEHPGNRQQFIVKLVMALGNRVPPIWTFQRGEGAGAKVLWSRAGEDVMIIQNQIKVDSAQIGEVVVQSETSNLSHSSYTTNMSDAPVVTGNSGWGGAGMMPGAAPQQTPMSMTPSSGSPDDPFGSLAQAPSFFGKPKTEAPPAAPSAPVDPSQFRVKSVPEDFPEYQSEPEQFEEPAYRDEQPGNGTDPSSMSNGYPLPPPIKLDMTALTKIQEVLSDPTTGLMTFPAYVYFLFKEFARYKKDFSPLSVIVFEIALTMGRDMVALPEQAVGSVGQRVRSICSALDVATHLGGGEFSAILGSTDSAGALQFATALRAALTDGPLFAGAQNESVMLAIGAACIPDTCDHPEVVIAAARQAKELAKQTPDLCVLFPVGE